MIKIVDTKEFRGILKQKGFNSLVIQFGNGRYVPSKGNEDPSFHCDSFALKPSIGEEFEKADLVICHAGAGTIMEALRKGKKVVAVANQDLMDNHQKELANAMKEKKYVESASLEDLYSVLRNANLEDLNPLPPFDPSTFSEYLDDFCGFK